MEKSVDIVSDLLDRTQELLGEADGTDWIIAIAVGVVIQLIVLLIMRIAGIFFRMASWIIASAISVFVALWILDRRGIPESIGGRRIEDWVDDARRAIGI